MSADQVDFLERRLVAPVAIDAVGLKASLQPRRGKILLGPC